MGTHGPTSVVCVCVPCTLGGQPAPDITRKWTCQVESSSRHRGHQSADQPSPAGPRDTAQWPGGRRCRGDRGRCARSEHRLALRAGWPVGCGGGTPHSRVAGLRPGGGPVQVGPGGRATYPAGPAQHRQGHHLRRLGRDVPAGSQPGEFPDRPDRPAPPVPWPGTGPVTRLGCRRPRGNPGAARRPAQLLPVGRRRLRPVVPGGHLYRRAGQPRPGLPGGLPAARGRGHRKRAGHRDIGHGRPSGRCRDEPPAGRGAGGRGRGRRLGTPRRRPGRGAGAGRRGPPPAADHRAHGTHRPGRSDHPGGRCRRLPAPGPRRADVRRIRAGPDAARPAAPATLVHHR
jgi:hypothetical protein